MWQLSGAFEEAYARADQLATARAELWLGGQLAIGDLTLRGGSVKADATGSVLRTADVDLLADELVAETLTAAGAFTPYGAELRLWRGLQLPDGTVEEAPLGVFVLDDPELSRDSGGVEAKATGSDRAVRYQRARWNNPFIVRAGTTRSRALENLLVNRWPAVEYQVEQDPTTMPLSVYDHGADTDPWADAQALAQAMGQVLTFDREGRAVSATPDLPQSPVRSYSTSDVALLPLTEVNRRLSGEAIYTGVVASGESSDESEPVRAEAWDDDPDSPTYYLGPLGKVPYFLTSPVIRTKAQARSAAASQLTKLQGAAETLAWSCVADPTLDPGDLVRVEDEATGSSGLVVVESIDLPLVGATMTVTGATRRWAR